MAVGTYIESTGHLVDKDIGVSIVTVTGPDSYSQEDGFTVSINGVSAAAQVAVFPGYSESAGLIIPVVSPVTIIPPAGGETTPPSLNTVVIRLYKMVADTSTGATSLVELEDGSADAEGVLFTMIVTDGTTNPAPTGPVSGPSPPSFGGA